MQALLADLPGMDISSSLLCSPIDNKSVYVKPQLEVLSSFIASSSLFNVSCKTSVKRHKNPL